MHSIAFWPTLIALTIAAATDIRSRRIPNWLVVPFLAGGLIAGGVTGGPAGVAQSVTGIAVAAALAGVLYYLRGMGMGDLKLCAAVGGWIGPAQLVNALVAAAIAGGLLALGCGLWTRSLGRQLDSAGELVAGVVQGGFRPHPTINLENPSTVKLPYAVAIAIGTMFSFFTL